jgi:hypothetical protein
MKDVTTRENLTRLNNSLSKILDEFNSGLKSDRIELSIIIYNFTASIDNLESAMEESKGREFIIQAKLMRRIS